jgi:hypothetical protein
MARRVAGKIGLRLHDAAEEKAVVEVVNEALADQEAGEGDRVERKLLALKPARRVRADRRAR